MPCGVPTETKLRSSDADVAVKSKDAIIQPVKPSDATFSFEVRWVTPPSETSISLVVALVQQSGQLNGAPAPLTN